jgi:hypothetical protein
LAGILIFIDNTSQKKKKKKKLSSEWVGTCVDFTWNDRVYKTNFHAQKEIKENIQGQISQFTHI